MYRTAGLRGRIHFVKANPLKLALLHLCQRLSICSAPGRGMEKFRDDSCTFRSTGNGCERIALHSGVCASAALPLLFQRACSPDATELDRTRPHPTE